MQKELCQRCKMLEGQIQETIELLRFMRSEKKLKWSTINRIFRLLTVRNPE